MHKTCIIIPCYNEAHRIDAAAFENFLSKEKDFTFCFADDGSTDDTIKVLQQIQLGFKGRVFITRQEINNGKAAVVRKAVLEMNGLAQFDYLGYFDADLSTPLEASVEFVNFLEQNENYKIVFGSRIDKPGVVIKKLYYRYLAGRSFSLLVNRLFGLTLYDTQCGAKIFRKDIALVAFEEPFVSKWLFDIEIILRLRKAYSNADLFIKEEALLQWVNKKGSKITFNDLLKLPWQMLKMRKKYC